MMMGQIQLMVMELETCGRGVESTGHSDWLEEEEEASFPASTSGRRGMPFPGMRGTGGKATVEWKTCSIFRYWCLGSTLVQNLQACVTGDSKAQPGLRYPGEDPNMRLRTRGAGSLRLRKHGHKRRRKAKENMSWKSIEKAVSDTWHHAWSIIGAQYMLTD